VIEPAHVRDDVIMPGDPLDHARASAEGNDRGARVVSPRQQAADLGGGARANDHDGRAKIRSSSAVEQRAR